MELATKEGYNKDRTISIKHFNSHNQDSRRQEICWERDDR